MVLFANIAARVEVRYPAGLSAMFESPEAILLLIETSLFAIDAKSDMGFSRPQSATDFEWGYGVLPFNPRKAWSWSQGRL